MTNHNSRVSSSEGEKIFTAHWQIALILLKQDVRADFSESFGTKASLHTKRYGINDMKINK